MESPHGGALESSAAEAVREIWLVAPFIKEAPLRRLLKAVKLDVRITVVTRWNPAEVASGVSDLGCRALVNSYQDSDFRLLPPLHAKYYRFDDDAYVGSANLTKRGLGWTNPSNVELLIKSRPLDHFESEIHSRSTCATDEMQKLVEIAAAQIPIPPGADFPDDADDFSCANLGYKSPWFPRYRRPDALFDIQRSMGEYPHTQVSVGIQDLKYLAVSRCENETQFNAAVAASLIMQPTIASLIDFAAQPRRFGEVRRWVGNIIPPDEDATLRTQAIYRWVQHFLPEIFEIDRPRHSEIIRTRR